VSSATLPAARTVSAPLVKLKSALFSHVRDRVPVSLTCVWSVASSTAVWTVSTVDVEDTADVKSSRVAPSVTNPTTAHSRSGAAERATV
jgi:hypothetical protein